MRSSILSVLTWGAVLCASGLVSQQAAFAQAKIGIIDLQRAVTETAEIKKAQNEMLAKYKVRQDTLEKAQRELSDIQTQLQASQGKLSAAGEADLQARGQRKQREAQRLNDDLQADVDRDRQDILQRVGTRMTDIVKKLSDEKGLDVVMEKTAAIAFRPALEITTDAVAAYDKAFPVK